LNCYDIDDISFTKCGVKYTCIYKIKILRKYSGTPLIRTPKGHDKVSALSGCPYKVGYTVI